MTEERQPIDAPVVLLSLYRGLIVRPPTMRQIAEAFAAEAGVTVEQLRGARRSRDISHPRQKLMHRLYATGRWSTTQIGIFLGHRDHSTVIYGWREHAKRMAMGTVKRRKAA